MTTAAVPTRMLTPPEVAKRYGVSPERVISWVRAGELRAIDVASRSSRRPRYRIDLADLPIFEANRAVVSSPQQPRRRRRRDQGVIEFF